MAGQYAAAYRVVGHVVVYVITRTGGANPLTRLQLAQAVAKLLMAMFKTPDISGERVMKRFSQVCGSVIT